MLRFAENLPEASIVATLSRQLGWSHFKEIIPLNRDCNPMIVTPHEAPEMVVVGEWVATID